MERKKLENQHFGEKHDTVYETFKGKKLKCQS